MGITVLGPLTVDGSERLGPRDRVVLQALATRPGQPVSAEELMDALWGDKPPASAAKNLQSCIVRLRKTLGAASIETSARGYALIVPADMVDAQAFEAQVARARELLAVGEADRVAFMLEHTLALWRGTPFADLPDWPPAQREAGRLDELRLDVEEMYVDALMRSGRPREVLARGHAMVRAAPLRERRWELLALAQYRSGAQGEALRTIRQLRAVLAHELGIDPSREMAALEQSILRQDVGLTHDDEVPQAPPACPWQGLRAYDVTEADRFFGRETEIEAGLAILAGHHLLALVGPSGSGKSSLMRAGIGARLHLRGTRCVTVTPGRRPTHALTALSSAGAADALLVDQAEELFTLCEDPDEARAFIDRLVEESSNRLVVVALRADRLADLTAYPPFSRLVERGLYLVGGLDEAGLRQAVIEPARQAGLILEPGLVDVLVTEVRDDPGALPLLSHALQETWKRREGNTLTVDGYRATGGIHGAVSQSAEQLYAQVEPDSRQVLRNLVLRLLSPGTDGEPVRARVPRRLVGNDPEHDRLIELLVSARLVTSDDGVLEITHESLARAWPRLRGWLEDDVDGRRILHHLSSTADVWNTLGRPDSELYRGVRLTRALDWAASTGATLTDVERGFLQAARAQADVEERSAAERVRAQARLIRRLRVVLSGAVILLVLALAAGGLAAVQSDRAGDNAAMALANATAAEARRVGTLALATEDIDESMRLAVAGVRLDDSPETRSNLQTALARHPELIASTQLEGTTVAHLDVSPDGRSVATYDDANRVRLYEIASGELLAGYSAGSDTRRLWTPGYVSFSPDGRTLAVTGAAPTRQPVRVLDAASLEPAPAQPGGLRGWRWQADGIVLSRDGRHLAAVLERVEGAGDSKTRTSVWAVAWDLEAPRRPIAFIRLSDDSGGAGVVLSPDGGAMLTSFPLTVHDLSTGTSREVDGAGPVARMALSPDGRLLAASLYARPAGLVLLDATTGELRQRLPDDDYGWPVVFSGDGSRVATVMFEKREAQVWDVDTARPLARVPLGENGEVLDLSPDGSILYTAGSGGPLRHWDLDGERRFLSRVAATKGGMPDYLPAMLAPGGERAAVPSDEDVAFVDVATGAASGKLDRGTGYATTQGSPTGTWHPDGVHFALATGGEVRIWNAKLGELVGRGSPGGRHVSAVDYSTDGTRLVSAELSGRVTMLDSVTLTPVGRPVQLEQSVCCVSAGPDNRTALALTGRFDASGFFAVSGTDWALLDLVSGTVLDRGELGFEGKAVDYSPDGQHAAVGGRGGEVVVLTFGADAPLGPSVVAGDGIGSVTYSPDGHRILASGNAASVALLDGATGLLLARVLTPEAVTTAGFRADPDGVLIATTGDGPIYEWDTDPDRAIAYACRVAGRGFNEAEWTAHFGGRPYQETCPDE